MRKGLVIGVKGWPSWTCSGESFYLFLAIFWNHKHGENRDNRRDAVSKRLSIIHVDVSLKTKIQMMCPMAPWSSPLTGTTGHSPGWYRVTGQRCWLCTTQMDLGLPWKWFYDSMILWYVLISYTAKIIENHWSPIYPKANKWKEGWAQLSFTATLPQNDVFQPRFLRSLTGKYLDVDGDDIHARNIPSIEDVLRHVYHMICLLFVYY